MKRYIHKASAALLLLSALTFGAVASAAPPPGTGGGGGGGGGGGHEPPTGEAASNNLSYPVIWSDGVMKADFTQSTALAFAGVEFDGASHYTNIGGVRVDCVGETDITPPQKIPPEVLCYFGRLNEGLDEATGQPVLTGEPRVWWLQQRQPHNAWQAFNIVVDPAVTGPVVVTGVDTGDLLESSIAIKAKKIRTEFTLLRHVATDDAQFGLSVLDPFVPALTAGTFQAFGMSGAVPGTDQSIAETQGTDYGPSTVHGAMAMVDPATVKTAKNYFDPDAVATEAEEPGDPRIVPIDPPLGMHATVYSACARLIIQKLASADAVVAWSSELGYWTGQVQAPFVDAKAWDGSYSAEINAGGSVIYGYNWDTKVNAEGPGTYRLTFLLDGDRCIYDLNTVFDDTTMSVNVGERRPATLMPASQFGGGEGGLVYVDVDLGAGGGGGGGKKGGGKP